MRNEINIAIEHLETLQLVIDEINNIIDYCHDPYGDTRALEKEEVRELVEKLEIIKAN